MGPGRRYVCGFARDRHSHYGLTLALTKRVYRTGFARDRPSHYGLSMLVSVKRAEVSLRGTGPRATGPVGAVGNRAYRGVRAYKARLRDRVCEGQAPRYGPVGMSRPGGLSYVREGQALALRGR